MDHQLVVNKENQAGTVAVTDRNSSGLNFDIKTKHHNADRAESEYEEEASVDSDVPMFVNELANPAKKGTYEGKNWGDFSGREESESDVSRGRNRKKKKRRVSRSRSRSVHQRPSAGFSSIKEERLYICLALKRMKDEGVKGIINFDENTDIDELRMELKALEQDELVRGGILNCRSALITISAGVEIANKRFNPFDIELNGWSQHLYESIETFDGVFERLTKKYAKRIGNIAPEAQLLVMLAGNAFSYCFMRSMIKACEPSMAKVASDNPELIQKMMESLAQQSAASQQNANGQPWEAQAASGLQNPIPGTMPVSTRGTTGKESDTSNVAQKPAEHVAELVTERVAEPVATAPVMTGPDKDTLNALIQRAQKLATEASSESSSLISIGSESIGNMSLTDTIASSIPDDKPKKKGVGRGRGRPKKDTANVIDI